MSSPTDNKQKIAALWNDGMSATQIGAQFGISRNAVVGIKYRNPKLFTRNRVDTKPRPPRTDWTAEMLDTAETMHKAGSSSRAIGAALGLSVGTVASMQPRYPERFPKMLRVSKVSSVPQAPRVLPVSGPVAAPDFGPADFGAPDLGDRRYAHKGRLVPGSRPLAFHARAAHQCCWPLADFDDAPSHMMPVCGGNVAKGRPYCGPHSNRAARGLA